MDIPQRILSHTGSLFLKYGVRSITMDEIARDLGISKKTIYQYFPNKAEIVTAVSREYFEQEKAISEKISQESHDAIDEILRILNWTVKTFEGLAPNLLMEIQKFYPVAWSIFQQFQQEYLLDKIRQNLEWGIRDDLYRSELDTDMVSKLRLIQIMHTIDTTLFPSDGRIQAKIQRVSMDLYLHSILTLKGLQVYEERINFNQSTNQLNFLP